MHDETGTIMAVDDTPENLKVLMGMLQGKGYRVLAFPGGKMALEAAIRNPPDLILLDIQMPEMNGFEVCERLKAHEKLKDIPVLFISALNETIDKIKAFSVGGVDYITKPFQFEEVNARIQTQLHMRKMQIELEKHNHHLEDLVHEKVMEISDSQIATILAITKITEIRDDNTGHHIERTRAFCRILAEKLHDDIRFNNIINDAYIENIYNAASLHDIGKVGISDSILQKPGKLSPAEFDIMKTHTSIGADALKTIHNRYQKNTFIQMGIAITQSHHEKWDGSGYPEGLAGEDIPLCARIMALADVYDALRSVRPYKQAFSHKKSICIITEGSGLHFDPAVVDAFKATESEFARIYNQTKEN